MADLTVKFAVYGALAGGNAGDAEASSVCGALQDRIDNDKGVLKISNSSLYGDPSPGNGKYFAAIVERGGGKYFLACKEG